MGRHEGMLDNLHDGPVTCVGALVSQHFGIQFPEKSIGERCEEAIASTSSPSGSSILPIDQVRLGGTVRHTTPPGGRWEFTNEQQVDEVGGSRCSVALYSRPGSRRICDAAR